MRRELIVVSTRVSRLLVIVALAVLLAGRGLCGRGAARRRPADARHFCAKGGLWSMLVLRRWHADRRTAAQLCLYRPGPGPIPGGWRECGKNIQAAGVYGPVSAILWDGKQLPYAENLVNLLVADEAVLRVSPEEVLRVLSPLGRTIRGGMGPGKRRSSLGPGRSTNGRTGCTMRAISPRWPTTASVQGLPHACSGSC